MAKKIMHSTSKYKRLSILSNPLLIPLVFAIVVLGYFLGRNDNLIANSNQVTTPTLAQFIPSPTNLPPQPLKTNVYQPLPSSSNGLSLEDRQRLGRYKAQIEETLRKTKEQEEALRKQIDEARKHCEEYNDTKDECLASIRDMEIKLNTLISENEKNAYPLREKLAEINALLGT